MSGDGEFPTKSRRVPAPDAVRNYFNEEVDGNKEDAAVTTPDTTSSQVAYLKGSLNLSATIIGMLEKTFTAERNEVAIVDVDNAVRFEISIIDNDSGPVASGDITPGTITITRYRAGAATVIVNAAAFLKANGRVYYDYTFVNASWATDDSFLVEAAGISFVIGGTTFYPSIPPWFGFIGDISTIEGKIDVIDTEVGIIDNNLDIIRDREARGGTAYFVGIGGSDGNDGLTWATRFLTNDYAVGQCTPDSYDTIVVGPGAFDEDTSADGVLVDVAGIMILGSNETETQQRTTFTNTNAGATSIFNVTADDVTICKIYTQHSTNTVEGIIANGKRGYYHHIRFFNTMENGIRLADTDNIVEHCVFDDAQDDHIEVTSSSNTIRHNIITSGGSVAAGDNGIAVSGNENKIYDNKIMGTDGTFTLTNGINVSGDANFIADNFVSGATNNYVDGGANNKWPGNHTGSGITAVNTIEEDLAQIASEIASHVLAQSSVDSELQSKVVSHASGASVELSEVQSKLVSHALEQSTVLSQVESSADTIVPEHSDIESEIASHVLQESTGMSETQSKLVSHALEVSLGISQIESSTDTIQSGDSETQSEIASHTLEQSLSDSELQSKVVSHALMDNAEHDATQSLIISHVNEREADLNDMQGDLEIDHSEIGSEVASHALEQSEILSEAISALAERDADLSEIQSKLVSHALQQNTEESYTQSEIASHALEQSEALSEVISALAERDTDLSELQSKLVSHALEQNTEEGYTQSEVASHVLEQSEILSEVVSALAERDTDLSELQSKLVSHALQQNTEESYTQSEIASHVLAQTDSDSEMQSKIVSHALSDSEQLSTIRSSLEA